MSVGTEQVLIPKVRGYYDLVDSSVMVQEPRYEFQRNPEAVESIVDMFANNAVYLRDGSAPFSGKENIRAFFGSDRSLMGQHQIESNEMVPIGRDITGFSSVFPEVDRSELTCLKVEGKFTGAQFFLDTNHTAQSAHGTTVPFTDYWVFQNDKVIYRYSNIRQLEKGRRV